MPLHGGAGRSWGRFTLWRSDKCQFSDGGYVGVTGTNFTPTGPSLAEMGRQF